MPEEFSLALTEVAVAVERAGLPPNWRPFEIPSVGFTVDEHVKAHTDAWDALCRRGLARGDKLDLDVEDTLRTWTQPDVLINVRAAELVDQRHVYYRAASAKGLGVFSEHNADGGILFTQVRAERLVDMVVGALPHYNPVPLRELVTVSGTPTPERDLSDESLISARRPRNTVSDKEAIARFAAWPLHRHGSVELSVKQGLGTLHHVGSVQFLDTDGGRFLTFTDNLPGGETRYRFVPSDGSHLRRWLHDSIADDRR
ncbi:MAG: hypothetical protein JWQ81_5488 [Amycolatopsis sp.]|uniref:ESX secretion-associated protein EspG n=1 Tax=Amycolatopsis sp. TaxID=37632 RepID=UPI002609E2C7|nr:ESX secretion-associated protein EspG [Amycolatopsis sp.]MCU1684749.1 hypothetical protein [Amycolatopsis sp.]